MITAFYKRLFTYLLNYLDPVVIRVCARRCWDKWQPSLPLLRKSLNPTAGQNPRENWLFTCTGWAKKVIPLVHYITLYERYHFFWPTLYIDLLWRAEAGHWVRDAGRCH